MEEDYPENKIYEALEQVLDPELGIDVVNLGLVYGVRILDNKTILIDMTLTTPGCPVSQSLPDEAKYAVEKILEGEYSVEVNVVWDPPWSPVMLSEFASRTLGFVK